MSYADAIIVLLNDGGSAVNPAVRAAIDRGAGFMGIHYAVEVSKGKKRRRLPEMDGRLFRDQLVGEPGLDGLYYVGLPDHPVARGVKPFTIKDEWYYHMRFVPGMVGVTPILAAVAPKSSLRKDPQRGTNPTVAAEVAAGKPQVLAWTYGRPNNGGRGFGFTGMHYHANLANDNLRTVLLNAVAWTAGLEVPKGGVPWRTPSPKELDQLIEGKEQRTIRDLSSRSIMNRKSNFRARAQTRKEFAVGILAGARAPIAPRISIRRNG